jgi:hypothetical protein
MRPQFHHIDAKAEITKSKMMQRQRVPARPAEARVVQQMARATGANGEEFQFTKTAEFMTKASEEPWTHLRYHDEDVTAPTPHTLYSLLTYNHRPRSRMLSTTRNSSLRTQKTHRSSSLPLTTPSTSTPLVRRQHSRQPEKGRPRRKNVSTCRTRPKRHLSANQWRPGKQRRVVALTGDKNYRHTHDDARSWPKASSRVLIITSIQSQKLFP